MGADEKRTMVDELQDWQDELDGPDTAPDTEAAADAPDPAPVEAPEPDTGEDTGEDTEEMEPPAEAPVDRTPYVVAGRTYYGAEALRDALEHLNGVVSRGEHKQAPEEDEEAVPLAPAPLLQAFAEPKDLPELYAGAENDPAGAGRWVLENADRVTEAVRNQIWNHWHMQDPAAALEARDQWVASQYAEEEPAEPHESFGDFYARQQIGQAAIELAAGRRTDPRVKPHPRFSELAPVVGAYLDQLPNVPDEVYADPIKLGQLLVQCTVVIDAWQRWHNGQAEPEPAPVIEVAENGEAKVAASTTTRSDATPEPAKSDLDKLFDQAFPEAAAVGL